MEELIGLRTKNTKGLTIAFTLMLLIAFSQCYKTTHDLHWASDPDFDRDISFVQGTLDGQFGKDPSYTGEYLWYTPLLFSIETSLVRLTGLPAHDVVTKAGTYLNLLAPIAFFLMLGLLFGYEIALAGSLSFLFLAAGNILGWGAATYSPWLYPVCFAQFLFYFSIIVCYKAFAEQKFSWFMLLGALAGITFLAHAAPAILLLLIMIALQAGNILQALKRKEYPLIRTYLLQGLAAFIPFLLTSLPLTWYVIGKYHLHIINRYPSEYSEGIFIVRNFPDMIRANATIATLVALIGFIWFLRKMPQGVLKKIILCWLVIAVALYVYATGVAVLDDRYNIHLPDAVPSSHYFFYCKAVQSVFFAFGFIWLLQQLLILLRRIRPLQFTGPLLIIAVLACTLIAFPSYRNRLDFRKLRTEALAKEAQKDKLDIYNYILNHIPADKVILCDNDPSLFPVMPTARKMVCNAFTFSNPYVDFGKRESDRHTMLSFISSGQPLTAAQLFKDYQVDYVLLPNAGPENRKISSPLLGEGVFNNGSYTLFTLKDNLAAAPSANGSNVVTRR